MSANYEKNIQDVLNQISCNDFKASNIESTENEKLIEVYALTKSNFNESDIVEMSICFI